MKELHEIVQGTLQGMFDSGKIAEMIEAQLDKTIREIIGGTLREYSDFGKGLKAAIEAQLPTSFDDLKLADYNAFIMGAVQEHLSRLHREEWKKDIEKMLAEMFEPLPAEIKLSELANQMRKYFRDEAASSCSCDGPGSFTFIFEPDKTGKYFGGWLFIDKESRHTSEKYSCKYRLALLADGTVYGLSIDGQDQKNVVFLGPHYNFERLLMGMYYGKTKLVIDIESDDEIDTSLSDY
jgi:hypothetical protein